MKTYLESLLSHRLAARLATYHGRKAKIFDTEANTAA